MYLKLPLAADIFVLAILFVFGACMGSFIDCAAGRRVAGESFLKGRSRCVSCGAALGALELIPIFSYIFLGGKCRRCGAPIPVRCLFCELITALVYVAVYLVYGFGFITLEYIALVSALIAVALIDYDSFEIPDGLVLFGAVLFGLFLYPHGGGERRAAEGMAAALIYGGGMLLISIAMDAALKKETLGGGDVKLIAMLGLYTGLWGGLLMIIVACIAGLAFAFARRSGKGQFPFGPAIVAAAVFTLLFGRPVIDFYLSLVT